MAATKTSKREVAEKLCERFPDANNLSLARRLYKEHPGQFSNLDAARSMIRHIRGVYGEGRRKNATHPKEPGFSGQLLDAPPSIAKPWDKYFIRKAGLVGIISDAHIPYQSDIALNATLAKLKELGINTLLINGDFADWYEASRWEKNPDDRIGFRAEMDAVKGHLQRIRKMFKNCQIVYKAGNHEERWNKFIWNKAPELWDIAALQMPQLLGLKDLEIDWVEDQRVVMVGKLPVMHGHELPTGIATPVNPARGAYNKCKHSVLVGHSHRSSSHNEPDMFHTECAAWSTGCLCNLNPAYRRINAWNWGFACVEVLEHGTYNVQNYRISKEGEVRTS